MFWRSALGEVTVLAVDGGEPIVITAPGADIWALLEEPMTVRELADALAEIYSTSAATIAADLGPLLEGLRSAGVVTTG